MAFDNPGPRLERLRLPQPVVSCDEAAGVKGVDLERELKSLLLTTSHGPVLVHVRGNHQLSLRAVKKALATHEARLASLSELTDLGSAPGTVHPFASALWELPQLVTQELLDLDWVTTNAGEASTYVVFGPQLLLAAPKASVGNFER
jgi:prolyl-tRNA editing enzyme YbaK/EbsC (Cys-tRNA(Pro) deacylase)